MNIPVHRFLKCIQMQPIITNINILNFVYEINIVYSELKTEYYGNLSFKFKKEGRTLESSNVDHV